MFQLMSFFFFFSIFVLYKNNKKKGRRQMQFILIKLKIVMKTRLAHLFIYKEIIIINKITIDFFVNRKRHFFYTYVKYLYLYTISRNQVAFCSFIIKFIYNCDKSRRLLVIVYYGQSSRPKTGLSVDFIKTP